MANISKRYLLFNDLENDYNKMDVDDENVFIKIRPNKFFSQDSELIGRYVSNGTANGNFLYMGPKGGLFYYNSRGNKTYLDNSKKINQVSFF